MHEQSCLIIAGEKSGEEHALSFFNQLKIICPLTSFYGVGGDELKHEGLELLFHLNDFSSWGYSEVLAKIPFYINAMNSILKEVEKRNTKTAILIDFQSFNLKLAGKLKERGVQVLYYVAPQAWAWKEYRVKKLSKSVHTLFTIIPFEKKWFSDRGVKNVISIDHPLWTTYQKELETFSKSENESRTFRLLLLPGSRKFEVETLLPLFIEAVSKLKKEISIKVSIVKSSSVPSAIYDSYNTYFDEVFTNEDLTSALKKADFSFAASGTVTLTCALFEVPTIVCYKTSLLNQFIYETVVNYRGFISLANIIQNRLVFPEFLQDQVSSYNIVSYFRNWYYNNQKRLNLKTELKLTRELVCGEKINIPQYMAEVIKKSYGKKVDSNI
ncbi:MAG: lipid-A-disaccharide synthase [Bacteriovoracaceae bacterium]|nr:lipid-A-disaccharide synthase [Bacteriovoracaceae bacterium]